MDIIEKLTISRKKIKDNLAQIIVGQENVIDEIIMGILSNGHVLLVGVPGLAKTLLITSIAKSFDLDFKRVQFTPDLMPSDITGTEILEDNISSGKKEFKFIKGPLFTNILLADEINRTPPKTQSALLQAMQEREVSAGNITHKLADPFFVLATQNPIEQEGTYPLPEAQLDRFIFKLIVDYPKLDEEKEIVKRSFVDQPQIEKVLDAKEIKNLQSEIKKIPVTDKIIDYAVKLVRTTRPNYPKSPEFIKNMTSWGAGPRASQYLVLAAKINAAINGKYTPEIEDVKRVSKIVLRHRILPNFRAEAENVTSDDIIEKLLEEISL